MLDVLEPRVRMLHDTLPYLKLIVFQVLNLCVQLRVVGAAYNRGWRLRFLSEHHLMGLYSRGVTIEKIWYNFVILSRMGEIVFIMLHRRAIQTLLRFYCSRNAMLMLKTRYIFTIFTIRPLQ